MGKLSVPTHLSPLDWHVHEMLYGYVAAAIAGFLLTAIPNWTGRLPVNGYPLAALVTLWIAGRAVNATSAILGAGVAGVIDVAFLLVLAAVAAREIVAGENWRNLRVLVMIGILALGNVVFHAEVFFAGTANYGIRISLAAVIALLTLIGGRVVPSFTHNWIVRSNPGRLPVAFSRFDAIALASGAAALLCWIVAPLHPVAGWMLVFAAVLHLLRLLRWAGDRTIADRLVLVLHAAYAFVPAGFALLGLSILAPEFWPASAGLHAWATGAIGVMTLAVMTRASLGHTRRALAASIPTQLIYGFALMAAFCRIVAAFAPSPGLLCAAAGAWVLAFGGFAVVYGPMLFGSIAPKRDAPGL
jgi:uncharacterized protein involved in response to NO